MEGPREEVKADADEEPLDFEALTSPDELVRGEWLWTEVTGILDDDEADAL